MIVLIKGTVRTYKVEGKELERIVHVDRDLMSSKITDNCITSKLIITFHLADIMNLTIRGLVAE